jgi:hypothetical protein
VKTAIGLFRDFIAAVLGLLILFGVDLTDEQIAGLLLVVTTGAAFGTYVYDVVQSHGADPS